MSAESAIQLHERLRFELGPGQVCDGPRRYLLMRADVLMGAFDGLPQSLREEVLRSLGASVARFGGDSVRAYLAEVGPQALLRNMEEASASLGWGRWSLQLEDERLRLAVRNSPFAAGAKVATKSCHAIAGMLQAVGTALWSAPVVSRELRCACEQHRPAPDPTSGECLFEAVPAAAA